MSLNETVKTLILVKADTSQAKAEMRSLRGEERKAAQERLAELDKQNGGIEKQIAFYGKMVVAIGSTVVAFKAAKAAADGYLQELRLQSAAAGADMERLRAATMGLVESDQLLAFAGKSMNGVWKLNQKEMETILHGATALRKTMGVELQPTVEKLTEAIAKGSTRALKEFGIEAKNKQEALRQLDEAFKSIGGNAEMAGDEMARSAVSMNDALDDLSDAFGQLVVALGPAIEVLADAIAAMARYINMLLDPKSSPDPEDSAANTALRKRHAQIRESILNENWASNPEAPGRAAGEIERVARLVLESMGGGFRSLAPARGSGGKRRGGGGGGGGGFELQNSYELEPFTASVYQDANAQLRAGLGGMGAPGGGGSSEDIKAIEATFAAQAAFQSAAPQGKDKRTYLETVFGTPAEIDALTESLKLANDVFVGFSEAVVAGFDAWITGQESVAAAFTKAVAEMMRSLAKQMAMEALKHGAMALGAIAIGGPLGGKTAAEHGVAAAAFAGVAVAAGGAAKALGQSTGQWSQGGGSSGASPGAARTISNRSAGSESNAPITIYVGAEWAGMSAQQQSASIRNAIRTHGKGSRHIRKN